ncbi:hypothetical protein [Helicobacter cetorum]|uniref:Lipoprotein n=1 Tax=Helicobacter cetorum (strain ATCC BAA-540 / CCUG 52418 / MIT 99-5656) TaxID=1163745 RepID=I0EQF6_HELCM|nr:hypothetical protein [Helicobacter cetorum]AFI05175.1 hypothetical protein HCD_00715 [Helicobacter cetorum MIT 99-5656]
MKFYVVFVSLLATLLLTSCLPPKGHRPSLVSVFIAHQGQSVRTYWRKIDREVVAKHNALLKENQKAKLKDPRGRLFALGRNHLLPLWKNSSALAKLQTFKLESGFYYLDSFSIHTSEGMLQSSPGYPHLRNGYDFKNNRPFFLAFEVKPNSNITLPSVELSLIRTSKGFLGVFLFNNNEKGANTQWIEGSLNQELKNISLKDTWELKQ